MLTGANPGALIDNLNFAHSDGSVTLDEEEAIIYSGLEIVVGEIKHEEDPKEDPKEDQRRSKIQRG